MLRKRVRRRRHLEGRPDAPSVQKTVYGEAPRPESAAAVRMLCLLRVRNKKPVHCQICQKSERHERGQRGRSVRGAELERLGHEVKKCHRHHRSRAEAQYQMQAVAQAQGKKPAEQSGNKCCCCYRENHIIFVSRLSSCCGGSTRRCGRSGRTRIGLQDACRTSLKNRFRFFYASTARRWFQETGRTVRRHAAQKDS